MADSKNTGIEFSFMNIFEKNLARYFKKFQRVAMHKKSDTH